MSTPRERILAAGFGDSGVELFDAIQGIVSHTPGVNFGEYGLDVGAADGRYLPVIRELGITTLTAIDPDREALLRGISEHRLRREEAWPGTLEEFVVGPGRNRPADSAFAFNVHPDLVHGDSFTRSLAWAVQPGGMVLATFMEYEARNEFAEKVAGQVGLLKLANRFESPNNYFYLGRRSTAR